VSRNDDLKALIEALKVGSQPQTDGFVPKNAMSILVMGIVAAAGGLVWATVTKTPESFSTIQSQTAEIRTTVLEMRTSLQDLSQRLQENTRQTSDVQTKVSAVEQQTAANRDRIQRLEEQVNRDTVRR